jgi:hypothetical protein
MKSAIETSDLTPLAVSGNRLIGQRWAKKDRTARLARWARIRLSLSERERIKMRNCWHD